MTPYLSIIVPIYNAEMYIRQCLDSILNQTFTDFELILVDDGSPDNCPSICDEYRSKDSRVKVVHKKNEGLVNARKSGLEIAVGEYIGYVDSDDWIEPTMYECMCEKAILYDVDIVICDFLYDYPSYEIRSSQPISDGYYDKSALKNEIYPYMLFSGVFFKFGLYPALWNKIYRRDILKSNQFNVSEDIRMGEDVACIYSCLLDSQGIFILKNKFMYHYRQIPSSMKRKYDDRFFERILILYDDLARNFSRFSDLYNIKNQQNTYFAYMVLLSVDNELSTANLENIFERKRNIINILNNVSVTSILGGISFDNVTLKLKIKLLLLRERLVYLYIFQYFAVKMKERLIEMTRKIKIK